MNKTTKDGAVNFLMALYFGIKPEDKEDIIVDCLINRAYRDAASHVLSVKDDYKKTIKLNCIIKIKDFLKKLNDEKDLNYDDEHRKICTELFEEFEKENKESNIYKEDKNGKYRKMTYGIAQKWVNMSVKYVYTIMLIEKYESFFDSFFSSYIDNFHVPLDSIMIEKIKSELKVNNENFGIDVWSSIDDYDKYLKYQKKIKKCFPNGYNNAFEWEYLSWLNH